jgi:polyisoprenoid-binding protein YceI
MYQKRVLFVCPFQSAVLILWAAMLCTFVTPSLSQDVSAHEYTVSPGNSSIIFKIQNRFITFVYGRFNEFAGTVTFSSSNPSDTRVDLTIKSNSVDTNNERRDKHLRNEDFFDMTKYPEITFVSTEARHIKDNVYELTGDLTLHGTSRPVTVQFAHTGTSDASNGRQLIGGECTFSIKRSEFGMGFAAPGIADEVTLTVSIEAKRTI